MNSSIGAYGADVLSMRKNPHSLAARSIFSPMGDEAIREEAVLKHQIIGQSLYSFHGNRPRNILIKLKGKFFDIRFDEAITFEGIKIIPAFVDGTPYIAVRKSPEDHEIYDKAGSEEKLGPEIFRNAFNGVDPGGDAVRYI
ncbi:MAG: hypothetical protein GF408_07455, partial [Candidatus Omnitrophica bacterium]|nr:hypothetical protein [Candidatus Omnitrophota bacterium]